MKYPTLVSATFLATLLVSPPVMSDELGSILGGLLKKATEVLKDPNAPPILEVPVPAAEAPSADTRIPVPNDLYSPMDKKTRLQNLFASAPRPTWDAFDPTSVLRTRDIGYPRLAVRFLSYGPDLPCWTIQAFVWDDAKTVTEEAGKVCRGPIWRKDAVGKSISMSWIDASSIRDVVVGGASTLSSKFANTGEIRTVGPNPPAQPFGFVFADSELNKALGEVISRLAIHTGYMTSYDLGRELDQRFWGVDFEPIGLIPSTRARDPLGRFVSPPKFTSAPPL